MATQSIEFEVQKPCEQLVAKKPATAEIAPYNDLLTVALNNNAAIDVIERLAALQEKALDRAAEEQFNIAMNHAQSELGRIAPDLTNPQTHSRYASYAAIDRVLRPIYSKHGFSLSFDTGDAPGADMVRAVCYVSHRAGHTRTYRVDMPADGKGAKGGDVMTKTHATGAAMSYGMRYLLKYIFNVAIGEEDSDGTSKLDNLSERLEWIENCSTFDELKRIYAEAYKAARTAMDAPAMKAIVAAYEKRKREFS